VAPLAVESRFLITALVLFSLQLSLLDPKDKKPVEVEFRVNTSGERVRVSKRSGFIIEW